MSWFESHQLYVHTSFFLSVRAGDITNAYYDSVLLSTAVLCSTWRRESPGNPCYEVGESIYFVCYLRSPRTTFLFYYPPADGEN